MLGPAEAPCLRRSAGPRGAPMPLVLVFRDRPEPPVAVDLAGILPERLRDLDAESIRRLTVRVDGRSRPLGEVCDVSGSAADGWLVCRGDCSRVHRIGAGMAVGRIEVDGNVGRHAGEGMTGGELVIGGSAGDWLACEMAGGEVRVAGSAGDNVAAALPGSPAGMTGGLVVILGSVGHLAGARMRRGILAVGGDCGEAVAFEMRAGTVLVAGCAGAHAGLAMRRGSVIIYGGLPQLPPGFRRGVAWSPPFLPLVVARLARAGLTATCPSGPWRQWHGDGLEGGRGEVFAPDTAA